jgi:uncharacterized membrane protein
MTQDVERPRHHLGMRHLERLVMLSDGVFAIAITLSALEIKPEPGGDVSMWQAWALPLSVYFLSFMLIGVVWLVHRRIVAWLNHVDGPATVLNMVLLSQVALVPVVVRFAVTHPKGGFLVYFVGFTALYLAQALLWGYLAFVARLAVHASAAEARQLMAKLCFAVALFAAAALYAVGWTVAAVACVVAALPLRWLAWRHGRAAAAAR